MNEGLSGVNGDNTFRVKFPTKQDVQDLIDRYNADPAIGNKKDMVMLQNWNGGCWKVLFEGICAEKAKEYGMDPWDVFAALIQNFFEYFEYGTNDATEKMQQQETTASRKTLFRLYEDQ